jgi:hypothetical protein
LEWSFADYAVTPASTEVNAIHLSNLVRLSGARWRLIDAKVIVMDSTTILLVIVPLVLGLVFNAVKFMRFIGFVAGGGRRSAARGGQSDSHLSFDERVAERLRELQRDEG